jgi:hypothetical protein
VRDNACSTQYAARILDYADGEQRVIYALDPPARQVYRLRTTRDWLDPSEARELRSLVDAYWAVRDALPERLRRAMWRCEFSCWIAWADAALPIIVSGLEALLKTERNGATRQFVTRVSEMADYLGLPAITADLCGDIYDGRSEWVHGAHFRLFDAGGPQDAPDDARTVLDAIAPFQDLLRLAVRRAVEDPAFREIFIDEARVRARWPLPG